MRPRFTVVVTAADENARKLVPLEDVRETLTIKSTDTAQDSWLGKVIARASTQAENYCGRVFAVQVYRDTFVSPSGAIGEPLRLSAVPVLLSPAASVVVDGTGLADADLNLDPRGMIYRASDPLRWFGANIVAEYSAGFETIPPDVQQAVIELVVMEFRGRGRDPMLRGRESPGLGREEFWVGAPPGGTLPADVAGLLNPYRRGLIG